MITSNIQAKVSIVLTPFQVPQRTQHQVQLLPFNLFKDFLKGKQQLWVMVWQYNNQGTEKNLN